MRTLAGLAPARWWRRPPFLPLPDRGWLAFRMETAYGDPHATPSGEDLVAFLSWARTEHARRRGTPAVREATPATR